LRRVSFEVQQGEILGIIGRNGAGKSTLLKVLSRITEPSEGRARICGRVASLLEVGTGFHPELTGRENIFLNGAVLGMNRAEIRAKFDEIVAFAEVEKFLDTSVKHYSSGMYVRLAFAVAAHLEPEILVVDEVLAVGDAEFQKKCIGKMQDVTKHGRTVLFVSHQIAAIRALTKRCILLNSGLVAFDGGTADALDAYLTTPPLRRPDEASFARPQWAIPLIKKVVLRDRGGLETNQIRLGDGCRVEVTIDSSLKPLRQPVLGVVVNSITHGPVAGINTRMKQPDNGWGRITLGVLSACFDALPLTQGRYSIDIWIGDGPSDLDTVPSAAILDIIADDVYGSGVIPFASHGPLLLNPRWGIEVDS